MKRNPLIPFGIIATVGILIVICISYYGAHQANELANGGKEKTQDVANLKPEDIYKGNCMTCHGANLEGNIGPELAHIGATLSKDDILAQIKSGGGGMPPALVKGEKAEKVAEWLSKKK